MSKYAHRIQQYNIANMFEDFIFLTNIMLIFLILLFWYQSDKYVDWI